MKKAMMYLLLALGITLVGMFVCGAVVGFIAGFIDGYYGYEIGTTTSMNLMVYTGSASGILLCVILNWVFLKQGYAEYAMGRIPKRRAIRIRVVAGMMLTMAGLAVLHCLMNELSHDAENDTLVKEVYAWMHQHPIYSVLILGIAEATGNLIVYGAVLREILEWKHRPAIIIPVFSIFVGLFSIFAGNPMLMVSGFLVALFEALVYEYTRSIIPIIIGDAVFWIVTMCLVGIPTQTWGALVAWVLATIGIPLALKTMEPYKPID